MENILSELNSSQREAVENIDGPMMVIAGAGSGKTRVLTYRIAYMIAQGINPFNILSLTFTNKAAEEMKQRIIKLLGSAQGAYVWMGTFHSIFSKVLHIESQWIGYTSNFTIYDTDDSKSLIKSIIREKELDPNVYKPATVQNIISSAKSSIVMPEEFINNSFTQEECKQRRIPKVGEIYLAYNQRLKKSDAMDFDDLLLNMFILLRDFPEILYKYQHRFRYIMVDEYQDTNYVQYQIVKKLAAAYENLCVVGDDAQSIYSFRGANISNILDFKNDYPDYNLYRLEQNYRSTKTIIEAANDIIAHNKHQIKKVIWTNNGKGDKIKVVQAPSDIDEAIAVARELLQKKEQEHLSFSDFAILYRNNSLSRSFEEAFLRMAVPYRIYGGTSFYRRKEIKDMMAYYRLSVNFQDEEALRRIINYPQRGIGPTSMEKIIIAADQYNVPLWSVIEDPLQYQLKLGGKVLNTLELFVNKIKSYHAQLQHLDAYQLGKHIADSSGITQELRSNTEEKERYENLGELFNAMQTFVERPAETRIDLQTGEDLKDVFPSLDLFINEASLFTDADKEGEEDTEKVKMMTIHAAKGLEFPVVFLVGVEENILPSSMVATDKDLEEERRLFYVALTRAKQNITISFSQTRRMFGNFSFPNPSPFIREINENVLLFEAAEQKGNQQDFYQNDKVLKQFPKSQYTKSTPRTEPLFRQTIAKKPTFEVPSLDKKQEQMQTINVGEEMLTAATAQVDMRVYHKTFGLGTVQSILSQDNKIMVNFDKFGTKTLLFNFAKLKQVL